MYPSRFRYEAPGSLGEAIGLLRDGGDYVKVLAGGQSLIPLMKLRFAAPELIVDINNLPGLGYHRADPDGTLRIGALCRHADLEHSELLASSQPTMAAAAPVIAQGPSGRRSIPMAEFVTGPFENALAPDEIAVEALIPPPRGSRAGGYLKLERRVGDFATVGVAVSVERAGDVVSRAGIALTGVGGSTISATEAAAALAGRPLTPDSISEAASLAAAAARPRTDHRGSAEYKRHMVATFVDRILSRVGGEAAERAA